MKSCHLVNVQELSSPYQALCTPDLTPPSQWAHQAGTLVAVSIDEETVAQREEVTYPIDR